MAGHKKSQKRKYIWGQTPRKAITMKLGTKIDVHEVVTWAKFNL